MGFLDTRSGSDPWDQWTMDPPCVVFSLVANLKCPTNRYISNTRISKQQKLSACACIHIYIYVYNVYIYIHIGMIVRFDLPITYVSWLKLGQIAMVWGMVINPSIGIDTCPLCLNSH